jgi:hypothetical protein
VKIRDAPVPTIRNHAPGSFIRVNGLIVGDRNNKIRINSNKVGDFIRYFDLSLLDLSLYANGMLCV